MVKRKAKRPKKARRKIAKRKVARKKISRKKRAALALERAAIKFNRNSHWAVFRDLQNKADQAWEKLRANVQRRAPPEILTRDRNHLLLLLGECNYMAKECMRMTNRR